MKPFVYLVIIAVVATAAIRIYNSAVVYFFNKK